MRPALDGVRYAVLGIGDRSYDNFCGHAKSIDGRLADLGATRLLDRTECEAYDDEPMAQWADRGQPHSPAALGANRHDGRAPVSTIARPTRCRSRSPAPAAAGRLSPMCC